MAWERRNVILEGVGGGSASEAASAWCVGGTRKQERPAVARWLGGACRHRIPGYSISSADPWLPFLVKILLSSPLSSSLGNRLTFVFFPAL